VEQKDTSKALYILVVIINNSNNNNNYYYIIRYLILDILGSGAFGQVVKCRNLKTQEVVAVKVVKNKPAYFKQSMMEVAILEMVITRKRYSSKLITIILVESPL
jgi:serine/threonine protein kinase